MPHRRQQTRPLAVDLGRENIEGAAPESKTLWQPLEVFVHLGLPLWGSIWMQKGIRIMTVFNEIAVEILMCLALNAALLWFVHRMHYFETYMVKNIFPCVGGMDFIMSAGIWCIHVAVQAAVILGTQHSRMGSVPSVQLLILMICLFFAALIDGEKRIIPNILLGGLLGVRVVFWALEMIADGMPGKAQVIYQIIYTLILFLLLMLVVMIAKGGFGYGDVKLLVVLSLFLDYGMLMSMLLTALIAALAFSLWLMAVRKSDRKATIPFGPFFYMGFVLNSMIMLWI